MIELLYPEPANPNLLHELAAQDPALHARLGEVVIGDGMSLARRRAILPLLIELLVNAATVDDVARRLPLIERILAGPEPCETVH